MTMVRLLLAMVVAVCLIPATAEACDLFSFSSPVISQRFVVQDFGVPIIQRQRIVQRFDAFDFPVRQRVILRQNFGGFGGSALNIRAPFFRLSRFDF